MTNPAKNADLAKIHIAKKDLGLDDDTYRAMLWSVARVKSAADLDHAGRRRVLDHLRSRGWRPKRQRRKHHPGAPHNIDSEDRGPQMRKIEALLADAGRPWEYAHGIARRMFHVDRLDFCSSGQLRAVIAALTKDQQRRQGVTHA